MENRVQVARDQTKAALEAVRGKRTTEIAGTSIYHCCSRVERFVTTTFGLVVEVH